MKKIIFLNIKILILLSVLLSFPIAAKAYALQGEFSDSQTNIINEITTRLDSDDFDLIARGTLYLRSY